MIRTPAVALCAALLACAAPPATTPASSARAPAPRAGRAAPPPPASSLAEAPERVVLVSVTGLPARAYSGERPWMPTLAALARDGAAADAVVPVTPAAPGPALASLATGRAPAVHGVGSDHPLGVQGTDAARHRAEASLDVPALWSLARGAGLRTAVIGWPSSAGAEADALFPELIPARLGESSPEILEGQVTPSLLEAARALGVDRPEAGFPGPARDDLLVGLACHALNGEPAPQLVLLRLSQTERPLRLEGPGAAAVAAAFAGVDAALGRLLACLGDAGRLATTAIFVTGDAPVTPVHTLVQPNVALAAAGLIVPSAAGRSGVQRWDAFARSNGTTAFVYARDAESALLAREALGQAARDTLAFRVVSAEELIELATDREAWFGLEAASGHVFGDGLEAGRAVLPATARGAWGALAHGPDPRVGFVAWGAGVRVGLRIPELRQTDVAPTVASLLRLAVPSPDGRPLVGALRPPPPSVAAPRAVPTP